MANKENQEALNSLWEIFKYKFKIKEIDKAQKLIECKEILQQAIDRNELLEKALEMVCEKLSFATNDFEAENQEEAQSNYIYLKFTRPKELKEKYLKKASENV